jgi:hypothetical protein
MGGRPQGRDLDRAEVQPNEQQRAAATGTIAEDALDQRGIVGGQSLGQAGPA